MKCTACEKELAKKEALYTEDKLPYCVNPFTCNDQHPNSVENIVARKGAVKMFTEDELESNTFDNLNVTQEMKERIMKVATKPQSIRLFKVDIAYYVLQLKESKNLASISEAVRYCIEKTMEDEPLDHVPSEPDESSDDVMETEITFDDTPEPVKAVIKKPTVKVVPKSINVDWNEIDRQRKEAKPEPKKDEDELVF